MQETRAWVASLERDVADDLGITPLQARKLLLRHKGDPGRLMEAYLASPEEVWAEAGLTHAGDWGEGEAKEGDLGPSPDDEVVCGVCYDTVQLAECFSLHCGP